MCSSDIRLKNNVAQISDPLAKILSLRGVEFDWNEHSRSPGRHAIGVIAQDVEKVFPSAVIDDPHTGYKMVDYAVRVAPIIAAFKELKELVSQLFEASEKYTKEIISLKSEAQNKEREILALKDEISELKARMERIEKLGFSNVKNAK
jgi:trimeric autotransporter adhesin